MIELNHISKEFHGVTALKQVTASIEKGHVFGLIGSNGAGKSTLLRILCGILSPDEGNVTVDGQPVYENPAVKGNLFFISDDQYFPPNATPEEMMHFYSVYYPGFERERFYKFLSTLSLDQRRKINTFSKGMKKQLSVILGVCSGASYLLCDETFDGLDPVMRQAVKNLFIKELEERSLTPIIASHNLRELEDICDHVGLLHKGGILFNKDLDEMKLGIHKLQCVLPSHINQGEAFRGLDILHRENRGSLITLTVKGKREDIDKAFFALEPVFYEVLPLTLEEIFISETEVQGYDIKNLFL